MLAADSAQKALRLASRHASCRLAYCEMGGNSAATVALAHRLVKARPDLAVIALVRPPCPAGIRQAVADGLLQGVGLLPLTPEALRAKTRAALASRAAKDRNKGSGGILTREEVDFLLGRPDPDKETSCHRRQ